jgi:hypothetical protein
MNDIDYDLAHDFDACYADDHMHSNVDRDDETDDDDDINPRPPAVTATKLLSRHLSLPPSTSESSSSRHIRLQSLEQVTETKNKHRYRYPNSQVRVRLSELGERMSEWTDGQSTASNTNKYSGKSNSLDGLFALHVAYVASSVGEVPTYTVQIGTGNQRR